ncbi:MAG TPA: hypothetical protein VHC42_04165 [Rhizomicrobium sp.]|nr:hypothetical protein [Rhizomicrobium sp.]
MAKIPLERTIESAYRFGFTKFLSVLGVLWLPMLIVCALIAGVFWLAWGDLAHLHALRDMTMVTEEGRPSPEMMGAIFTAVASVMRFAGLIFLVVLIARAMVAVGVLRKALGLHEGPVFAYFSLGAPVWRMIGAMILATLIVVGVGIAVSIAVAIVFAVSGYTPQAAVWPIRALAIVAAALWMVYMCFRLFFFLPPVVVAENSIGIGRAWALGGGNFWRMLIVFIAVFLPVVIVGGILSNALFGAFWWSQMREAILSGHPVPPDELVGMFVRGLKNVWPLYLVFEIVYITLLTGIGFGAIASAYRSVTSEEKA